MSNVIPWSYSSLTSFETCPRKHYEERIAKSVKRPEFKQAQEGTDFHKIVEDYLNEGKEFEHKYKPQAMTCLEEICSLEQEPHTKLFTEYKIAVTRDLKPTTWESSDCYARGIMDLFQVSSQDSAFVGDWKTGRSDPFSTQLKLSALMVMSHYTEVNKVLVRYEWLKEGHHTKAVIHRDFLLQDWKKFTVRADRLERAVEENNWPEKPSGLCKKYCPVENCRHNGNYKK